LLVALALPANRKIEKRVLKRKKAALHGAALKRIPTRSLVE
jgi:hypothetical protein